MKVKTIKILSGMLAMLAFTACSSNIDESADAPRFYNVTLTASMGDADTRALSEDDNVITATFAENDQVVVVDADGSTIVGTLKALSAGESTTLSGTLDAKTLEVNEVVKLRYRSATANYDAQVGTLAGIAAGQDYAEGTLTVSTLDPLTFTSNSVTLSAKQSITKFTFKDASTNAAVSVKTFGIAAAGLVYSIAADATETTGAVTGTLATASSDVYVALRNNTDVKQTYAFTIQDNAGNWYKGTKKAKLIDGKNYTADVTLTKWIDKDATLNNQSADGAIGIVNGLPAIAVTINSTKVAVALMNVGALCPEAYGTYYTFANRASGLSNGWYVPTKDELDALVAIPTKTELNANDAKTKEWGAQNGVNGCMFKIEGNKLFLPAAGFIDNDPPLSALFDVSTVGYYWSSTDIDNGATLAYSYRFSASENNTFSEYIANALTVRPFHALPAQ